MKFIMLFTMFLFITNNLFSQEYFKKGIDYYEQGNYMMADSFLSEHLKHNPNDINARFNLAAVKLYLKDTCSFCNELYIINNPYEIDNQSLELYFKYCGSTDTIFYSKDFAEVNMTDSRYFEVIENHKCLNQIIGKMHYAKRKIRIQRLGFLNVYNFSTNIFAIYQLQVKDSTKFFIFTDSPPTFQGGYDKLERIIKNHENYAKAKSVLKLQDVIVYLELFLDKSGKVKNASIIEVQPISYKTNELSEYLVPIYENLPDFKPGKLKGQTVEYKILEKISF